MAEKKQSKRNGGPTGGGGGAGGGGGGAGSGTGGPMDVGLLEQLVKLMAANDLNTVDLRDGDKRVVLQRGQAVAAAAAYMPYPTAPQHAPAPAASSGGGAASAAATAGGEDAGLVSIKSEMVGTFYSKPSPDAKPFVGVGSDVDEDTVVCVIEAMKHFNPVKADVRGTIAKVLVTDGQTVDVGKPLFLVRPA
jgi:acetyl-CoA carboxylase biotin carboxyl carrier protein